MNDKEFDRALNQLLEQSAPQSHDLNRQANIKAALNVFNQENAIQEETLDSSQGIPSTARPNGNRDTNLSGAWFSQISDSIRSFFMNIFNNRVAYNALGTLAIAFVAVSLVFVMPSMRTETSIEEVAQIADDKQDVIRPDVIPADNQLAIDNYAPELPSKIEPLADEKKKQSTPTDSSTVSGKGKKAERRSAREQDRIRAYVEEVASSPRANLKANAPRPLVARPAVSDELQALSAPASTMPHPRPDADRAAPAPRLDEREEYAQYQSNPVKLVQEEPVSTFSIDVDTASYSLVRNQLSNGYLPKPQAVRAEEFINYFDYDYPIPSSKKQPFASSISVFDSPWNKGKKLVHIGIKGYDIPKGETPDSNLVFLLDVSGSMNAANKLPLVKQSIGLLLETLKPSDTISMVVYAGAAGMVLEPTKISEKQKINAALQNLSAGGSTAGGAGIQLAYQLAEQNFDPKAVNRIILATDGDFNVGASSNEDLKTLVERKRKSGVFLSVLGFGRHNYQDDMMQTLAQNGNGVAAFIDSLSEAKKVLVDEASSSLFTIAKDVKLQVEFNPTTVSEYRLVGYETRHLNREDFNNDKVDAGDIGAGHTVTAIYEITPTGSNAASIDKPRYAQNTLGNAAKVKFDEYGFLKIRYKLPGESKSNLIETTIAKTQSDSNKQSKEAQFSIAVAGFAQLLSHNNNTGNLSFDDVIEIANETKGSDPFGYRSEFIQMVRMAKIAK